jgi:hypothetical protein
MRVLATIVIALSVAACGDVSRPLADAPGFDPDASTNGPDGNNNTPDAQGGAVCGDSMVEGTEMCDLGPDNGQAGFCCSAGCQFADGMACTTGGGTTCCAGGCAHVEVAGTCDACAVRAHGPQNIAVIESQSVMVGHNMDIQWEAVAEAAGHTVTIHPQTALDNLSSFDGTDILIVSSGLIPIPANRRAVIDAYASSGRGVYLQGEYQTIYEPNITFGELVVAHGSTFTWNATVVGQQDPTTVNGCLATTPEAAPTLTAYWYACNGTGGAEVEVIHTAPGGQAIGWSFCLPGGGRIIHNTDQDFIRDQATNPTTPIHMRNVIVALADAANCDGGGVE